MENLPDTVKTKAPASIGGSLFLDVQRFEHAQRVAKMLATSTMIPEHFRNNIGNCVIALNLAERFMADPFMVMQNVYVVHGRPGLEGKLVIALINQSDKFTPLQFKFEKHNDKAVACTAYATHKETKEVLEQTVTWKMVQAEGWDQKKGSKWLTMPELMFQYRSATFFARVYCPEVILGMQTVDEIFDFVEMKKVSNGSYQAPKPELATYDTSEFDKLVGKYLDTPDPTLDKFLDLTAQAQAIPIDKLKVLASEDFEPFWKAFETWREKNYPAPDLDQEQNICAICGYKAKSPKGLKRHTTQQHTIAPSEEPEIDKPKPVMHYDKTCPECWEPCWIDGDRVYCKACSWEQSPIDKQEAKKQLLNGSYTGPTTEAASQQNESTTNSNNSDSEYIRCPVKNRGIAVENCTACEINKKCQTYAEYLHNHKEDKF